MNVFRFSEQGGFRSHPYKYKTANIFCQSLNNLHQIEEVLQSLNICPRVTTFQSKCRRPRNRGEGEWGQGQQIKGNFF